MILRTTNRNLYDDWPRGMHGLRGLGQSIDPTTAAAMQPEAILAADPAAGTPPTIVSVAEWPFKLLWETTSAVGTDLASLVPDSSVALLGPPDTSDLAQASLAPTGGGGTPAPSQTFSQWLQGFLGGGTGGSVTSDISASLTKGLLIVGLIIGGTVLLTSIAKR